MNTWQWHISTRTASSLIICLSNLTWKFLSVVLPYNYRFALVLIYIIQVSFKGSIKSHVKNELRAKVNRKLERDWKWVKMSKSSPETNRRRLWNCYVTYESSLQHCLLFFLAHTIMPLMKGGRWYNGKNTKVRQNSFSKIHLRISNISIMIHNTFSIAMHTLASRLAFGDCEKAEKLIWKQFFFVIDSSDFTSIITNFLSVAYWRSLHQTKLVSLEITHEWLSFLYRKCRGVSLIQWRFD